MLFVYVGSSVLAGVAAKVSVVYTQNDENSSEGGAGSNGGGGVSTGRVIFQLLSWSFLLIWIYEAYMEAFHVRSLASFVPLTQFGSLLFNAITGVSFFFPLSFFVVWINHFSSRYVLKYFLAFIFPLIKIHADTRLGGRKDGPILDRLYVSLPADFVLSNIFFTF